MSKANDYDGSKPSARCECVSDLPAPSGPPRTSPAGAGYVHTVKSMGPTVACCVRQAAWAIWTDRRAGMISDGEAEVADDLGTPNTDGAR